MVDPSQLGGAPGGAPPGGMPGMPPPDPVQLLKRLARGGKGRKRGGKKKKR